MRRQIIMAAFGAQCLLASVAEAQTMSAERLLAAAKQATGGAAWDQISSWHETGRLLAGGLTGTYESWTDFKHARSAGIYELGPQSGSQGYDGHVSWTIDGDRKLHVDTAGKPIADAIQQTYLDNYGFFFPERMPAKFSLAGTRQADGADFDVVRAVPEGAEPVELWFDHTTHRLAREVQGTGAQSHAFLLSGYKAAGGVTAPFRTVARTADNPMFDQTSETGHVALNEPIPDERYSPPKPAATPAKPAAAPPPAAP